MPSLYDYGQKKWIDVPHEQVQEAVASGQYQYPAEAIVYVFNPDGEPKGISGAQATTAFRNGYSYRAPGMTTKYLDDQSQRLQIEAQDTPMGQAAALGLGIARTASLGLSDVAARAIYGPEGADALRYNQLANPGLTATGEVLGAISPIGPAAAIGRAALGVGARVAGGVAARVGGGAAARVGSKAMQSVGARLGVQGLGNKAIQAAGKVGQSAVKYGTAGAIEGGAFGVQETLTDYAMNKTEATIENAIANVGLGAFTGGGIGLGLGGMGRATGMLGKAALDYTRKGAPGQTARAFLKSAYPALFKRIKGLKGESAEIIDRVFKDERLAKKILQLKDNPDQMLEEIRTGFTNLQRMSEDLADSLGIERKQIVKAFDEIRVGETMVDTTPVVRKLKQIKRQTKPFFAQVKKAPDFYGAKQAKLIKQTIDVVEGKIGKAQSPSQVHDALTTTRTELRESLQGLIKSGDKYKELAKLDDTLKNLTTDKAIWGNAAAEFGDAQRLFARYLKARDVLFGRSAAPNRKPKAGLLTRLTIDNKAVLDDQKLESYLRSAAQPKGQKAIVAFDDMKEASDSINRFLTRNPETTLGGLDSAAISKVLTESEELVNNVFTAKAHNVLFNRQQSFTGKALQGPIAGLVAGSVLGGPVAQAGLAGMGFALENPALILRYTHGIEAANNSIGKQTFRAIKSFLEKPLTGRTVKDSDMASKVRQRIRPITPGEAIETGATMATAYYSFDRAAKALGVEKERGESDVQYLTRAVSKYAGQPLALERDMRGTMYGMRETMPAAYAATVNTAQRAVDFLQTKLPAPGTDPFSVAPAELSVSQTQKLQSYVNAVFRPTKLIKELEQGQLKLETVEAVKAVYPEMFQAIQTKTLSDIAERKKKLNYQQRLQLSLLLGIPVSNAVKNLPQVQMALAISRAQEERQRQPRPPSGPPRSAENEMAGSAALQYRRST